MARLHNTALNSRSENSFLITFLGLFLSPLFNTSDDILVITGKSIQLEDYFGQFEGYFNPFGSSNQLRFTGSETHAVFNRITPVAWGFDFGLDWGIDLGFWIETFEWHPIAITFVD